MTAADALLAALRAKAGSAFRHQMTTTPWHSVDLAGERHELHLTFDEPAAANTLLDGLSDHDFDVGDSLVAEVVAGRVTADGDTVRVALEALTLTA